jgi:hypothetical protein
MSANQGIVCTVCGQARTASDGWFILLENRWTDRLKILGWSDVLARQPGVHHTCGPEHVQELVVHWMTTGSLECPFARESEEARELGAEVVDRNREYSEPDTRGLRILGELAVHRESLIRILEERPESLATILEALLRALGPPRHNSTEPDEEEERVAAFAEA